MTDQNQKLMQQMLAGELAMVWATSQFFTTLQNIMLEKELAPDVGLAELHDKMEALGDGATAVDSSTLVEVQRVLQRARASLAIIDSRIFVSVMRRFFERVGEFDARSLKHIARYYMSKPAKDDSDRDKIDLLLTRLCSTSMAASGNLKLRQPIENLEAVLEDICNSNHAMELESIQTATISRLRHLGRLILESRSFNTLIEGKLITQLREYKINLGDVFYVPMVLTEIIKINISVHNKFQELYSSEQARLRMETARMLHSLQATDKYVSQKDQEHPLHPMLAQLNSITMQTQQFIQELKRNLTDQIVQDRTARALIEADGNSITLLIASLEESLKRSRDLLNKLQEVYMRLSNKEAQPRDL
jgi:hypothetical protein